MRGRGSYMKDRTLTVKGTGHASLPPDYIEISLYLEAKAEQYDQVIQLSEIKLEQLRHCLQQVGISKSDLKTTNFTLDTDYEQVKDEQGNYVRVFRGYVVRHHLKLGFHLDNEKLAIIIQAISTCPAHPEFSIQYQLKDQIELKSLVLEEAVKNATHLAKVLADEAKVTLGPIQMINYDTMDISYQPREVMYNEINDYSVALMDLQPEDISATDTVTMVWELV